jgi:glycosyltransferase involved in cell wall biosynthesis
MPHEQNNIELSIVMPCLNEAETLAHCIRSAKQFLSSHDVRGEVIVADNGSSDGSPAIAEAHGARVVFISERGYGHALQGGIAAARGCFVIMGDADASYDFANLAGFLEKLREGYDLVMGNRFQGGIKPGAMPPLHRYVGNPVLSGLGRLFFRSPCQDFHCGLRGFRKETITGLDLRTTGMEFASEMVVKASLHNLRICEVPTTLSPDGRNRKPHLRSWRDGWRNLRFLLVFSPNWLFLYPGSVLMLVGFLGLLLLFPRPLTLGGITFDIHTMLYCAVASIIGLQMIAFSVFSKAFAVDAKLLPPTPGLNKLRGQPFLEFGIIIGVILSILGVVGSVIALKVWESHSFGPLIPSVVMRLVIPSITVLTIGIQCILAAFFLAILGLARR